MTTIKSHTDLEQSKTLAEILPHESADMFYSNGNETQPTFRLHSYGHIMDDKEDIPCWSIASLLGVLPYDPTLYRTTSGWRCYVYNEWGFAFQFGERSDNPVDACVNIIIKLKELNKL